MSDNQVKAASANTKSDTHTIDPEQNVPGGIEEALRLSANGVDVRAVAEQFAVRVVGPMI
jgi:hypothetical protein